MSITITITITIAITITSTSTSTSIVTIQHAVITSIIKTSGLVDLQEGAAAGVGRAEVLRRHAMHIQ